MSGGSLLSAFVTTSEDVTAVSQDLYLAAVSSKAFRPAIALNGLGLLWTQLGEQCSGRSSTGVSLWTARGVPAASGPVSAQLTSSVKSAVITVVRYSGADSLDPIGASVSANTNGVQGGCASGLDSAAYSADLAATSDDAVIFGAVGIRQRTHTPGPSYAEIAEVRSGTLGATSGLATQHQTLATAGVVPVDGSMSDTVDWAVIGLEIVPASPAGPCGDAICSGAETCSSCAADCGACAPCVDADGDLCGAFGSPSCTLAGADCNDADPAVFPGAAELLCDGIDSNCSGMADDDADADVDGVSVCAGDCNDADPAIFPGASELLCDGIDSNCNGLADDDTDADLDGVSVCAGDCDDGEPSTFPGGSEVCSDQIDNNCNLLTDCEDAICSETQACQATPVPALPSGWVRLALGAALLALVSGIVRRRSGQTRR